MHSFKGRDLLTLAELTPDEILHVLDVAEEPERSWPCFEGASAGLIFMKPSLRTRVSFEVGCVQLGIHPVVMGPYDAFSREETVHDTIKVLERYVDLIVLRTFAQSHIEEVAEHASVPVINALTDDYHPCQGLADLLTIRQHKGALKGLKLAYVGDGNNMAHTYLLAGALTGMDVVIAGPAGYAPSAAVVAHAEELAAEYGTGARSRSRRTLRRPSPAPTWWSPTPGRRWARRPSTPSAWRTSRATRWTPRSWPRPTRPRSSCTAFRPTGARK